MDYFQAKEIFGNAAFDEKCIRKIEITFTEGKPLIDTKIFYGKTLVNVNGQQKYLDIESHVESKGWGELRNTLSSLDDVTLDEMTLLYLQSYKDLSLNINSKLDSRVIISQPDKIRATEIFSSMVDKLSSQGGVSRDKILSKLK